MPDTCKEHSGCLTDIENLKKTDDDLWEAVNEIRPKLNMILGGVILSPFIVAAFTLVIAVAMLANGGGTTHP